MLRQEHYREAETTLTAARTAVRLGECEPDSPAVTNMLLTSIAHALLAQDTSATPRDVLDALKRTEATRPQMRTLISEHKNT